MLAFLALRWLGNGSSFPFGKRGEASSPFPLTPVNGALLILFAMLAVGLLRSSAPDRGISTAAHALAGLVVLIAIYDWAQSPARAWLVVAGLVALGVGFALTAPVTTDWAGDKLFQWSGFYEGNWPRLSKLSNSNNVAGGLEVAVPLALALIASGKRGLRIWGALALPPLLVMLILLQSRGALFAVALGLSVYATLHRRWLLPLIPLALLAGLALNNLAGGPLPTQYAYLRSVDNVPESLETRTAIWQHAAGMLLRAPLGIGVNNFETAAALEPAAQPPAELTPNATAQGGLADVFAGRAIPHAHNLFLQIGLDTGIIGLGAFVVVLGVALYRAWRAYRQGVERALAIGVLAAFVVILTHGMLDLIFWNAKPELFLWATIGLALRRS